jgi:anti-sigma B factor antagonist
MRELTQNLAKRVILDMSRVNFLDSSGLGAVVASMKALAPERKLELSGLTPTVQKVFRLTRMDSVFIIHDRLPAEMRHAG